MKKITRYLKVWWRLNVNSILPVFSHRFTIPVFLAGKLLRFVFFGMFLIFLTDKSENLAGYTQDQIVFFYLTYFLIDTIGQTVFREVYRFKQQVISGSLDLLLLKPVNPLFRILLGGGDVIDFITLPPLAYLVFHYGSLLTPNTFEIAAYLILVLNGILISAAFHIAVIAMAVITLDADNAILIFRDTEGLAKLPVDIYNEPLRFIITFILPVGVMFSLPVKALMGLVSIKGLIGIVLLGVTLFYLSLKFWHFALKKYTSASS